MKILTGNSNRPLAEAIAAKLALPLVKANIRRFSDNEIFVYFRANLTSGTTLYDETRQGR